MKTTPTISAKPPVAITRTTHIYHLWCGHCYDEYSLEAARYVGITAHPKQRLVSHLRDSVVSPKVRWIKKHGVNNIQMEIVDSTEDRQHAYDLERQYIASLRMPNTLVNLSDGGEGALGVVRTAEQRRKMSEGAKGRIISPEQRIKLSQAMIGRPSHRRGKPLSEEHRRNISKSVSGNRNHMTGRKHSEDAHKNMVEAQRLRRLREAAEKMNITKRTKEYLNEHDV